MMTEQFPYQFYVTSHIMVEAGFSYHGRAVPMTRLCSVSYDDRAVPISVLCDFSYHGGDVDGLVISWWCSFYDSSTGLFI